MKLVWSGRFVRAVKRLTRRKPGLVADLEATLHRLESDTHHARLRTQSALHTLLNRLCSRGVRATV